jgi:hypothetical protein
MFPGDRLTRTRRLALYFLVYFAARALIFPKLWIHKPSALISIAVQGVITGILIEMFYVWHQRRRG